MAWTGTLPSSISSLAKPSIFEPIQSISSTTTVIQPSTTTETEEEAASSEKSKKKKKKKKKNNASNDDSKQQVEETKVVTENSEFKDQKEKEVDPSSVSNPIQAALITETPTEISKDLKVQPEELEESKTKKKEEIDTVEPVAKKEKEEEVEKRGSKAESVVIKRAKAISKKLVSRLAIKKLSGHWIGDLRT